MSVFEGAWQRVDVLLALTRLDRDHQPITVGLTNLSAPHLAAGKLHWDTHSLFAVAVKG